MSLVRLLAAGRSVMGLRKNVSPYRLTDQRLLPTFGSNKGSGPKPDGQPGACLSPSPVQGELRLERVKVVRNDLSDSDLACSAQAEGCGDKAERGWVGKTRRFPPGRDAKPARAFRG